MSFSSLECYSAVRTEVLSVSCTLRSSNRQGFRLHFWLSHWVVSHVLQYRRDVQRPATPLHTTPVHKASLRVKGLAPKYRPLTTPTRTVTSTVDSQTIQSSVSTAPLLLHAPRAPTSFHVDKFEDAKDRLQTYYPVAALNMWDENRKFRNVNFTLQDATKTWFENHDTAIAAWRDSRGQLLNILSSNERKERAGLELESRALQQTEGVAMFVADMTRHFNPAVPSTSETYTLRHLMRGMTEQLFLGLVRDPPSTVVDSAREAVGLERALQQRFAHYCRSAHIKTADSRISMLGSESQSLRELPTSIVLGGLEKFRPVEQRPNVGSDAIPEEIRQAVKPMLSSLSPGRYVMAAHSDALS